jgi:carboxymethylenebutenolidase
MTTGAPTVAQDYLVPPEVGHGPGVLVLHAGRGLTPFVRKVCHRLARVGYVAFAPDLFDGETPGAVEEAEARKAALDEAATARRLEDTVEFLRQHESVSRGPVGVLGIGYGAEWGCRLAAEIGGDCAALVLFYGLRDVDWSAVSASVLRHFAQFDHEITKSRVTDLRKSLRAHDIRHDLFVYENTEPSFFESDESARYDVSAAQLAYERTFHFLGEELRSRTG